MITKILMKKYSEYDVPVYEDYFKVNNNFEPIYNIVYYYLKAKGYHNNYQRENINKRFSEELQKKYSNFELFPGIGQFDKRKGLIIPKFLVEPNKIFFGAFKNAGKIKESGFIIKSNNINLLSKIEEIIEKNI